MLILHIYFAIVGLPSVGRNFESGGLCNGGMLILHIYFTIVSSPSVGRGLRAEVYVMVECSYFAYTSP